MAAQAANHGLVIVKLNGTGWNGTYVVTVQGPDAQVHAYLQEVGVELDEASIEEVK